MKNKTITWIFIFITIVIIILIFTLKNGDTDEQTAKCIGEKSIVYIKTGCSACKYQKELFGSSYIYLNSINCAITPKKCFDIIGTPTWIINGKQYRGVQKIEKLKELTGC